MATYLSMRWKRFLHASFYLFFGLLTLGLLFFTQKPLCINSRTVERIDRVSEAGTETVWRCGLKKSVPYSVWFAQNLPQMEARLQKIEGTLDSLGSKNGASDKKLQLNIWSDDVDLYRKQGNQVYISEKVLVRPQILERIVVKNWVDSRMEVASEISLNLIKETLVDSVLALNQGISVFEDLEILDPRSGHRIEMDSAAWPSVLKTKQSYCRSSWTFVDHLEQCQKMEVAQGTEGASTAESASDNFQLTSLITPLSLRPLLVKLWMDSYRGLYISERYELRRSYAHFVEDLAQKILLAQVQSKRDDGSSVLREFSLLYEAVRMQSFEESQFALNLFTRMAQLGILDQSSEAKFDLLYHLTKSLETQRDLLNELRTLSRKFPDKQVAVEDAEHLWLLPSMTAIPKNVFKKISADKLVAERCGDFSVAEAMAFEGKADKVLLAVRCDKEDELELSGFLAEGARSFALQNTEVSFVSLHLPSLLLKRGELENTQRLISELRSNSVAKQAVAQSLGWQNVEWYQKERAYAPRANIEGIQLFR